MHFPFSISPQTDDEQFMLEALKQAWKAFQADEVPVGAVLVKEGKIIARGFNQVEMLKDATAHAEMLCLTAGEVALDNWRLSQTTLYCTIEPCSMCAGAMFLTRISNLVWGAKDLRHGANGSLIDLFSVTHPTHMVNVKKGVLEEYCALLMKDFFQLQRKKKVKMAASLNWQQIESLLQELVEFHHQKMVKCGQRVIPHLAAEDFLQPNDFDELEFHPHFRYEEGMLAGVQTVQMALLR